MAHPRPTIDDTVLSKSSQARLSELLNIQVQVTKALVDEYDGIMGPDGQGWDALLDRVFPNSSSSDLNQAQHNNAAVSIAAASSAAASNTTLPMPAGTSAGTKNSAAPAAPFIPAAAKTADLTPEQFHAEWRIIMRYSDVRTKISYDQLARAHAAFVRWWGWAPTKEQMQRAREAARASWVLMGIFGPWCSPYATAVWSKANRDQSIAKIKELKKTDWEKASQLAAFVGVTLKQSDKPKAAKPKATMSKAALNGQMGKGKGKGKMLDETRDQETRPSLIVRLKIKAGRPLNSEISQQSTLSHEQVQLQDKPAIPTTVERENLPVPPMPYFGSDHDPNGNLYQILQDGPNHPPSTYSPPTYPPQTYQPPNYPPQGLIPDHMHNFGVNPNLLMQQNPPFDVAPAPAPADQTTRTWMSPLHWIADRATDLTRKFGPGSSNDHAAGNSQFNQSIQPTQPVSATAIGDPADTNFGLDMGMPLDIRRNGDDIADNMADNIADDDDDPNMQIYQEMVMHSSPPDHAPAEKMITVKQEEPDEVAPAETEQQQLAEKQFSKHSALQVTIPKPTPAQAPAPKRVPRKAPAAKPDAKKPIVGKTKYYNYAADMTPDPRSNGLISYVIGSYRAEHKKNLATNAAAMEKLSTHATAALPALLHDSQTSLMTHGLFRWDDKEVKWELTLEKLDLYVKCRAQIKKNVEGQSAASSIPKPATSNSTRSKLPKLATPNSSLPKPPKRIRSPYPDTSVVAISDLTPDSRVNAFAAYLAQRFYRKNGIDLMAGEDSKRKLMMYAHRNERRLHGNLFIAVNEMDFWDDCDLEWDMKGFQLDTLEDEWKKRFPPEEESESEQEEADGGDEAGKESDQNADSDMEARDDEKDGDEDDEQEDDEQEKNGEQQDDGEQVKGAKPEEADEDKADRSACNTPTGSKRSRSASRAEHSPHSGTRVIKKPRLSSSPSLARSSAAPSAPQSPSFTPRTSAWLPSSASHSQPTLVAPSSPLLSGPPRRSASPPRASTSSAEALTRISPGLAHSSAQEAGEGSHDVEHAEKGEAEAGTELEHQT